MTIRSRFGAWLRQVRGQSGTEGIPIRPYQAGQVEAPHTLPCPAVGTEIIADVPFGVWPNDADAVPSWRLEIERRSRVLLVPYRTRAQFEAAVAACEQKLASTAKVSAMIGPALPAHESARLFLKWVRETNRCHSSARPDGRYTNETLRELYESFCHTIRVAPSSEAHVRKHLYDLGGVDKGLDDKQGRGGRRERPTVWTILPSLAVSVAPLKKAA